MRKPLSGVWRDVVRDSGLDSTAKLVALVLSTYTNGNGLSWPSRATLAAGGSLGLRSVDGALRRLERAGFLEVERSRGRSSHRYLLTLPSTAQEMRRSEWATAQETASNRASDDTNRAADAHESVESAESGALARDRRSGVAQRACEECGVGGGYHADGCEFAEAA